MTDSTEPQSGSPAVPRNPDFDDDRVIWSDEYSGQYDAVEYSVQFDGQWKLFLEKKEGFHRHTGVETSDPWIDDRIRELTGVDGFLSRKKHGDLGHAVRSQLQRWFGGKRRDIGGKLYLEPKFPIDYFEGKRCLDLGCGAGRWTRTLLALGATVKSCDVSQHGLESTRRFNDDVEYLDLFDIEGKRHDLHAAFDFTINWGVVMCTHDPKRAFQNVALTVKPGGSLYVMIYAPTYHASDKIRAMRKRYHRDLRPDERLDFAYEVTKDPRNTINQLDMLNTFYNWTVPEDVIHGWFRDCGFENTITLNAHEPDLCAYHVIGQKKS